MRFVRFVSYDNTSSIEDMLLINQKVNMDKRKQIQGVLKKKSWKKRRRLYSVNSREDLMKSMQQTVLLADQANITLLFQNA